MTTFNVAHIQHDPAHCSCPGLFRSFLRGQNKQRLELTYQYAGATVTILSPYLLGPLELWVLQGMIGMADAELDGHKLMLGAPETEIGKALAEGMEPIGAAKSMKAVGVSAPFTQLAKEMGYAEPDSLKTRKILRECIKRLYAVTIFVDEEGNERGYHLLSSYSASAKDKTFTVGLNPAIAAAVAGDTRYIRIPMHEIRAIKLDATRLIHQRLCSFINEGCTHPTPINKKTFYGYIWHDLQPTVVLENKAVKERAPDPDEAARIQHERKKARDLEWIRNKCLRESLAEMTALGWAFDEVANGKWKVTRSGEKIDAPNQISPK